MFTRVMLAPVFGLKVEMALTHPKPATGPGDIANGYPGILEYLEYLERIQNEIRVSGK